MRRVKRTDEKSRVRVLVKAKGKMVIATKYHDASCQSQSISI